MYALKYSATETKQVGVSLIKIGEGFRICPSILTDVSI